MPALAGFRGDVSRAHVSRATFAWRRSGSDPTRVWSFIRRLFGRDDFAPGQRVIFLKDGTTGTVRVSQGGWCHVYWDDEPLEEQGGSRVKNADLRRV